MKTKKKKGTGRASASFKSQQVHSEKLGAFQYDQKPGVLLKSSTDDGKMSRADTELGRLVKADVFRSASQTVKDTNSNKRRYK